MGLQPIADGVLCLRHGQVHSIHPAPAGMLTPRSPKATILHMCRVRHTAQQHAATPHHAIPNHTALPIHHIALHLTALHGTPHFLCGVM